MKKLPILAKCAIILLIIILIAVILIFIVKTYGSNSENTENIENKSMTSQTFESVQSIEINLQKLELEVKQGEQVKVEYVDTLEGLKIEQNENMLKIVDEEVIMNEDSDSQKVIIYLPQETKFNNINLAVKDRNISIETLNATNVKLDIDGNYCTINNILSDTAELKNQSGRIIINDWEVKNVTMQSDSGNDKLNLKVTETATMNLNTATTEINLIGTEEDYQVNTVTENSSMYVKMGRMDNGEQTIGNGNAKVNINAQSAALYINYKANEE